MAKSGPYNSISDPNAWKYIQGLKIHYCLYTFQRCLCILLCTTLQKCLLKSGCLGQ